MESQTLAVATRGINYLITVDASPLLAAPDLLPSNLRALVDCSRKPSVPRQHSSALFAKAAAVAHTWAEGAPRLPASASAASAASALELLALCAELDVAPPPQLAADVARRLADPAWLAAVADGDGGAERHAAFAAALRLGRALAGTPATAAAAPAALRDALALPAALRRAAALRPYAGPSSASYLNQTRAVLALPAALAAHAGARALPRALLPVEVEYVGNAAVLATEHVRCAELAALLLRAARTLGMHRRDYALLRAAAALRAAQRPDGSWPAAVRDAAADGAPTPLYLRDGGGAEAPSAALAAARFHATAHAVAALLDGDGDGGGAAETAEEAAAVAARFDGATLEALRELGNSTRPSAAAGGGGGGGGGGFWKTPAAGGVWPDAHAAAADARGWHPHAPLGAVVMPMLPPPRPARPGGGGGGGGGHGATTFAEAMAAGGLSADKGPAERELYARWKEWQLAAHQRDWGTPPTPADGGGPAAPCGAAAAGAWTSYRAPPRFARLTQLL